MTIFDAIYKHHTFFFFPCRLLFGLNRFVPKWVVLSHFDMINNKRVNFDLASVTHDHR